MKGTIDFEYDHGVDIVVARPRWTLDTAVEVMRWHQLHSNYFRARFSAPKDMVVVNDAFDVLPKVATLWGSYRAKLHQTIVGVSVAVNSAARVRQTTQTSGVRYSVGSVEAPSVEAAIEAIVGMRKHMVSGPPPAETAKKPSGFETLRDFATPRESLTKK